MSTNRWGLGAPTVRLPPVQKPRAQTAPSSPANKGKNSASKTDTSSITTLISAAYDARLKDILKKEEEDRHQREGGFSNIDLPPFDPNAPRGGGGMGGGAPLGSKSRLDVLMEKNKAQHEGLNEQSDPKLLVQKILELENTLFETELYAQKLEAENQHLMQMVEVAKQSGALRGMEGQGNMSPREAMRQHQLLQEKEALQREFDAKMGDISARLSPYSQSGIRTPEQEAALRYHQQQQQAAQHGQYRMFPLQSGYGGSASRLYRRGLDNGDNPFAQ
ncbi:hypothetical protein MNV49_002531 [Pseudohyphozyma bogoriensis]|nr:hypothetical protein MNV49_002531 [Pseudohyphozyma bogoriensis]